MPEVELRAFAVEAKVAHQAALDEMLDALQADNESLDSTVAALDARARKVREALRKRVGAVAAIAAPAARLAPSAVPDER